MPITSSWQIQRHRGRKAKVQHTVRRCRGLGPRLYNAVSSPARGPFLSRNRENRHLRRGLFDLALKSHVSCIFIRMRVVFFARPPGPGCEPPPGQSESGFSISGRRARASSSLSARQRGIDGLERLELDRLDLVLLLGRARQARSADRGRSRRASRSRFPSPPCRPCRPRATAAL